MFYEGIGQGQIILKNAQESLTMKGNYLHIVIIKKSRVLLPILREEKRN